MNRHEAYAAERERIEKELGYAVSLPNAADFIKTAGKIVEVIQRSECVTFKEALIVLRIAQDSLQKITGGID